VIRTLAVTVALAATPVIAYADLPQPPAEPQQPPPSLTIDVTAAGVASVAGTVMTDAQLAAAMKELVAKSTGASVVLRADVKAQHGRVVQLMDLAKQAGIRKIGLELRQRSDGYDAHLSLFFRSFLRPLSSSAACLSMFDFGYFVRITSR
jgi:biopolymer transport protein ExbD